MKDFMMIFLGEDYGDLGLSPEQIQERMKKWMAWNDKMESMGIIQGGEALHPEVTRISGKDRVIADGPFVESKELVGGYYVIKVESKEKALEIAQDFPDFDLGSSVEVREVMVFDM
ncbi:MAG: YciI family protein [Bacteroidota bacterium]